MTCQKKAKANVVTKMIISNTKHRVRIVCIFNYTVKDILAHSWYPPGGEKILSCPLLCVPQIPSAECQGLRSWCLSVAVDGGLKRKYIHTSISTNIWLNQGASGFKAWPLQHHN